MKDVEFNTPLEKVERAAKAAVSVSPLVGTWTACDRHTNGIVGQPLGKPAKIPLL